MLHCCILLLYHAGKKQQSHAWCPGFENPLRTLAWQPSAMKMGGKKSTESGTERRGLRAAPRFSAHRFLHLTLLPKMAVGPHRGAVGCAGPPLRPPGATHPPPPPNRRSPTAAHGLAARAGIRRRLPEQPRGWDSLQRTHPRCRDAVPGWAPSACGVHRVPGAGGCGGSVPADCCRLPALPSRRDVSIRT